MCISWSLREILIKLGDSCHHGIVVFDHIEEAVFNILSKSNRVVCVSLGLPVLLNAIQMDGTGNSVAKH